MSTFPFHFGSTTSAQSFGASAARHGVRVVRDHLGRHVRPEPRRLRIARLGRHLVGPRRRVRIEQTFTRRPPEDLRRRAKPEIGLWVGLLGAQPVEHFLRAHVHPLHVHVRVRRLEPLLVVLEQLLPVRRVHREHGATVAAAARRQQRESPRARDQRTRLVSSARPRQPRAEQHERAARHALEPRLHDGPRQRDAQPVDEPRIDRQPGEAECVVDHGEQERRSQHRRTGRDELGKKGQIEERDLRVENVRQEPLREGVPAVAAVPRLRSGAAARSSRAQSRDLHLRRPARDGSPARRSTPDTPRRRTSPSRTPAPTSRGSPTGRAPTRWRGSGSPCRCRGSSTARRASRARARCASRAPCRHPGSA